MRLHSRCALIVAAAGSAVPMFVASSALAQVAGTVVQTRRDLGTGAESAVPGLPAATLAALAAANAANGTNTRVVWNEPTTANPGLSSNNGTPCIDSNGNVYFIGTAATCSYLDPISLGTTYVTGLTSNFSPTGNSNNRGVFMASAASGWANSSIQIIARDGSSASNATAASDGAPAASTQDAKLALLGGGTVPITGLPANTVLNGTNNGPGLAAGLSVTSNGQVLFNSLVAPITSQAAGTGTNTGAAFFTGNTSGFAQAAQNLAVADGTGGATFAITGSSVVSSFAPNTAGQFPLVGTLNTSAASPVINTTNNSGLWLASPSGNKKVFQRGDAATGTTGSVAGNYAIGAFTQNNMRISSSGVLFPNILAQGTTVPSGFVAPSTTQQSVLYYSPIVSGVPQAPQLISQSGIAVPASAGLTGYVYANTSQFSVGQQMVNNSGTVVFNAKFNPNSGTNPSTAATPIVAGTNDEGIMKWSGGTTSALFVTGVTPVPSITGATTFKSLGFSGTQTRLNNLGHYTFAGTMADNGTGQGATPGTVWPAVSGTVAGNDVGLFLGNGNVGAASVIARGGDVAPGTGGLLFGNSFIGVIMNNADMVVFQNTLVNSLGQAGPTGIFAYGPNFGLVDLFVSGNTSLLGANYPLSANPASYNQASNGDGGVQSLSDSGLFTFYANSTGAGGAFGANSVIMVMQIPSPAAGSLGLLGLAAVARRRRR